MRLRNVTLVLVLAAGSAHADDQEPALPPCTPIAPLTASQALVGEMYDATIQPHGSDEQLTIRGGRRIFEACVQLPASSEEGLPIDSLRRGLKALLCASRAAVLVTVNSRQYLVSDSRKHVWGEYVVRVEHVFRNDAQARKPLREGADIVVVRYGGAVCVPGGKLTALDYSVAPLEEGARYVLFLTYMPDARVYADGAGARRIDGETSKHTTFKLSPDADPVPATDVYTEISSLSGQTCE